MLQSAKTFPTLKANTRAQFYKDKTAEITAQSEYEKALAASMANPDQMQEDKALIEADTAYKNALKANIEAEQALQKLQQEEEN